VTAGSLVSRCHHKYRREEAFALLRYVAARLLIPAQFHMLRESTWDEDERDCALGLELSINPHLSYDSHHICACMTHFVWKEPWTACEALTEPRSSPPAVLIQVAIDPDDTTGFRGDMTGVGVAGADEDMEDAASDLLNAPPGEGGPAPPAQPPLDPQDPPDLEAFLQQVAARALLPARTQGTPAGRYYYPHDRNEGESGAATPETASDRSLIPGYDDAVGQGAMSNAAAPKAGKEHVVERLSAHFGARNVLGIGEPLAAEGSIDDGNSTAAALGSVMPVTDPRVWQLLCLQLPDGTDWLVYPEVAAGNAGGHYNVVTLAQIAENYGEEGPLPFRQLGMAMGACVRAVFVVICYCY
jgi:hypothetical protein